MYAGEALCNVTATKVIYPPLHAWILAKIVKQYSNTTKTPISESEMEDNYLLS